jgi:hypothetical protein
MYFSLKQSDAALATAPQYLTIVNENDSSFNDFWREFLNLLPQYSFRYVPEVFEYYLMLSPALTKNLSFIIKSNNLPIAFCPLFIEKINGRFQASIGGGGFLPLPILHPGLSIKQKRAIENLIHEEILNRLSEAGAVRWLVEADILSLGTDVLEDLLPARVGALDVSSQLHVMDLTQPKEELWGQLRHSAKSTINQGLKIYEFKVYDKHNFTEEIGDRHRLLHHKCSGRITRPIGTFNKMYSWVHAGCGLMFEQLFQGQTVQMIFVALGKETACGASAADDPDFKPKVPLTHSMNYFIYLETAKRGIKYYEVGETSYRDNIFNMKTEKEKSICDFKRGFGRHTLPYKRWIWFSNSSEELIYLNHQLIAYKNHLMIN